MTLIRSRAVAQAGAALAFALGLSAQESDPAPFARLEAEVPLRCFPTDHSPVYGESLATGDVVRVDPALESRNGYVAVRLPLGVLGFVHGDYADVSDDGTVAAKGNRVSFRYRPTSREAPVAFVDAGTEFRYAGAEGDWLRVRYTGEPAWVPETALLVFDGSADVTTLAKAWDDLGERHAAAATQALEEVRAAEAALALAEQHGEQLAALWERFRAEITEAETDQDYATLRQEVDALAAEMPEDSSARPEFDRLVAELTRQERALTAWRLLQEEAPPGEAPALPPPVREDPLGDFQTGWVRYHEPLFGTARITLEKGGQVLFELSSTRYDLRVFDGLEVAVRGAAGRPDPQSVRHLEVDKLEVVYSTRRR